MKTKLVIIAALIIWIVFHLPQNSISQSIYQLDNTDDFIAPCIGQSFTATIDGYITHIEVKAASNMISTLRIFPYYGKECSDKLIVEQKVKFNGRDHSKIALDEPIKVVQGKMYLFVFSNDNNSVVRFEGIRQDTYSGGSLYAYFDSPCEEYDLYFKVWETEDIKLLGKK